MKRRTLALLAGMIAAISILSVSSIQVIAQRPPVISQRTPPPPPTVKRQPPRADGSIVHVVQQGDTLSTIAFAYGVDIDQIRKLNNLPTNSNNIIVGQKLLIKAGVQPTEAPTATSTDVPTLTPTPTVAPPTPTPINNKPSICVKTFNDANQNHWNDTGEQPLDGIKIRFTDQSGKSQDISTEAPACFNNLNAGTFLVSAVPPKDYGLTTASQLQVNVNTGQHLLLQFGAAKDYQLSQVANVATDAASSASVQTAKPTSISDMIVHNTGLIVLAIAGLLFIGGMSVAFLARRA